MASSTFTLMDYSREKSSVTIYNGAITAISLPGFLTDFGAVRNAIDAITNGTMHKEMWVGDNTILSQIAPTSPAAQRELKWLVQYQGDTSNKLYQITLPTADPTGVDGSGRPRLVPGSDLANLDNTQIAAFVTAFETIARTPDDDTETVTVLEMRLVGRNT